MSRSEIPGREQFRLLEMTESDDEEEAFRSLQLSNSGVRRKKKVRLKRDQRNRSRKGILQDTGFRRAHWYKCCIEELQGFRLNFIIFILFLSLSCLTYFAAHLNTQFQLLQQDIMEERKLMVESQHHYHTQIQGLISNQTLLKVNISMLFSHYSNVSSQLKQLGSSIQSLLNNLESAPELKNLPRAVEEAKKNMAKFGSRLTDLDARVNSLEGKVLRDLKGMKKTFENGSESVNKTVVNYLVDQATRSIRDDFNQLNKNRVDFAKEIKEKLRSQEVNSAQNTKIIRELQNAVKNVNSKTLQYEEMNKLILKRLQDLERGT